MEGGLGVNGSAGGGGGGFTAAYTVPAMVPHKTKTANAVHILRRVFREGDTLVAITMDSRFGSSASFLSSSSVTIVATGTTKTSSCDGGDACSVQSNRSVHRGWIARGSDWDGWRRNIMLVTVYSPF
jgi:hypothetical protein